MSTRSTETADTGSGLDVVPTAANVKEPVQQDTGLIGVAVGVTVAVLLLLALVIPLSLVIYR